MSKFRLLLEFTFVSFGVFIGGCRYQILLDTVLATASVFNN